MPTGDASYASRRAAGRSGRGVPPPHMAARLGLGEADMGAPARCERMAECAKAAAAAHPLETAARGGKALSVAARVLRAEDAFGVLDVALDKEGGPPSDNEIVEAFETVRDALDHAGRGEAAREGRCRPTTMCANWCINWALADLADRDDRARAFYEAIRRASEAVTTVQCPVDVEGLRRFAELPESRATVCARTGESHESMARDLAARAGPPDWVGTAWVELTYRHSFVGARLVAAGHVSFSRVYAAERHDPFKYPKEVRGAALGRFGIELDDRAAYPCAMAALFTQGSGSLRAYLADRAHVLQNLALKLFGRTDAECVGSVKQLLITIDMGGAPGGWASRHRDQLLQGVDVLGVALTSVAGTAVTVATYRDDQVSRMEELAARAPRMVEAVRRLNVKRGVNKRDEFTAMSYMMQHFEGASREAKRGWLACRGGLTFNLQHDGIMTSMTRGMNPDKVAADVGQAVSAVLGYEVHVEVKSRPKGENAPVLGTRPSLCGVPSHPPPEHGSADAEPTPEPSEAALVAFAKAMGQSSRRVAPRLALPGPDLLTIDGGTRRVVYSYRKDDPVGGRVWAQRVVGGFHEEWRGKGPEWLEWARGAYRLTGEGRLVGDRSHPQCPLAAIFWWECDAIVRQAGKPVGVAEARFVLLKLLSIEAEYPVTHFVASDGSRIEGDKDNPETRIGRVAISVSGDGTRVLGGRMEEDARGFDRHSYEAETEAFLDHLADCVGSVTVFVTDCLSGSQAGTRFKARTDAAKAGCYRGVELDNVDALEQGHKAVLYLWVHSHVGITPNEAADVLADGMRDGSAWNEMLLVPSRFQLARIQGLKRGVGQAVHEMALGMLLEALAHIVGYTLLPGADTWRLAVRAPHTAKILKETDFNLLADARANRVGLMADRSLDDPAPALAPRDEDEAWARREYRPALSSWEWYRQNQCACPMCGSRLDPEAHCAGLYTRRRENGGFRATQTRWHALIECRRGEEDGELDGLRQRAAMWLGKSGSAFGEDARLAGRALQQGGAGLNRGQRWAALRFLLGVPTSPPDKEDEGDRGLMAGYAKGVLVHVCAILRKGALAASNVQWGGEAAFQMTLFARFGRGAILLSRRGARVVEGPGGARRVLLGGRRAWLRARGLKDQWESREWSRKALRAWQLWTAMAGPAVSRVRRIEGRLGQVRTKGREDTEPGEGGLAFDAWTLVRAVAAWRLGLADGSARDRNTAGRDAMEAAKRLVRLRHAGLDPGPARRLLEAKEVEEDSLRAAAVAAVVEKLVKCVENGSLPSLRRVGEKRASRMGRRDLDDVLAGEGRAPLRGGSHAVDRVLNVRRVGRALQVLVRWSGAHDDEWLTWARCNQSTKAEAKEMERRKYPARPRAPGPRPRPRGASDRSHLRRGAGSPPPAKRLRLRMADGRPVEVDRGAGTPASLGPTPEGAYGRGAGRSARGLPIVWESPGVEELRGSLWATSPGGVGGAVGLRKRKRSGLADEGLAKKRCEGT